MEKFQEALLEARKRLLTADHMATLTYPVVKDNRLLLPIAENIFLALTGALSSFLHFQRSMKRIPPFHDNFDSKFFLFTEELSKPYKLEKYNSMFEELRAVMLAHRESPVEFSRKENFVMYGENFREVQTITIEKIQNYLKMGKQFFSDIEAIMKNG